MSLVQDLNFAGKRVLITGAANGFGAAIAREFGACGAALLLADIEEEPLRAARFDTGTRLRSIEDRVGRLSRPGGRRRGRSD